MTTENSNLRESVETSEVVSEIMGGSTAAATYSPEDNKLRLYIGRVPRDEYERLRAEGWITLHKQRDAGGGDFAATWTPSRRDTALRYAGMIDDEDMGPADRAADRAERFGGYRDKRTGEAVGQADRFDAGPAAHGYQSAARAERAAARHDRIADRAGDAWSKAEYWQRRTAGVISHALYKSSPAVRMGRIKTIEAELRKAQAILDKYRAKYETWQKIAGLSDPAQQTAAALQYAGNVHHWGNYTHPRIETVIAKIKAGNADDLEKAERLAEYYQTREWSLYDLLSNEWETITGAEACALFFAGNSAPHMENDWTQHYNLRLAYENQMIEAQGGRAAFVEMIPGGFIGGKQIHKVNKSNATGRVVSVHVMGTHTGFTAESDYKERKTVARLVAIATERLPEDAYRAPTSEELAAFQAARKAAKAAAPKKAPCPLINPTDAEADRLQALWNARALAAHCESHMRQYGKDYASDFKPSTVCRITQAVYSANSKGSYARAETKNLCADATLEPQRYFHSYEKQRADDAARGPAICQVRQTRGDGSTYGAPRVIVLTEKPQKPLPASVWEKYVAKVEASPELVTA